MNETETEAQTASQSVSLDALELRRRLIFFSLALAAKSSEAFDLSLIHI